MHLAEDFLELAPVLDGFFEFRVLLGGESHGYGFAFLFAGPLVAGATGTGAAVLDAAVADPADGGQLALEAGVVAQEGRCFHLNKSIAQSVKEEQYIYCSMLKAHTPFFPAWRHRLGPMGHRLQQLRAATLTQLEQQFGGAVPAHLLAQSDEALNSRQRLFPLRRTFWCFVWQMLKPKTACREVVRQLQALLRLQGRKSLDANTSAYCQARRRLPTECLLAILKATAQGADQRALSHSLCQGRPVKVVDGSTATLPDTPANQRAFPQVGNQKPGCGFPLLKFVVLFSLASGAILALAKGNRFQGELRLLRALWDELKSGDILLGDRGFSDYVTLAVSILRDVDVLARLHHARLTDFRKGQYLGPQDRLVTWRKPKLKPPYLKQREWKQLPETLTVRILRFGVEMRGFRPRQITLVTTLLDPELYPKEELAALYLKRWRLELCLRDLKTTLGMEQLRCLSPAMVEKELLVYLIAHNFIRWVMAQAATAHQVQLERISFKGTVDAVRQFSHALAQARNRRQRRALRDELLQVLASDLVPERPGRREPRAVKRRPKPFALLNRPRAEYVDIPHRNTYYLLAKYRKTP